MDGCHGYGLRVSVRNPFKRPPAYIVVFHRIFCTHVYTIQYDIKTKTTFSENNIRKGMICHVKLLMFDTLNYSNKKVSTQYQNKSRYIKILKHKKYQFTLMTIYMKMLYVLKCSISNILDKAIVPTPLLKEAVGF